MLLTAKQCSAQASFSSWHYLLHSASTTTVVSSSATAVVFSTCSPPTTVASKGLDPSVVKTIPTFVYSTKASHFPPIECAVCLSDFENDEKARVLPKCNHTFHVTPPKILEQIVFGVVESAGSEPLREDIETISSPCTASSSSSSSSSSSPSSLKLESCPMKTLELVGVGILVETPTREDRLTGIADVGSGIQILSLNRIWSV
ncbi:hypothetical protein CRYUN_Cryun20dG0060200 [Craigia yunnanensis]